MKKHIPNGLTLLNLFCGAAAIPLVLMSFLEAALVLIGICLLADLLDGMVARWLKVDSALGIQLDSLADMVSFGVLPGIILFYVLQRYGSSVSVSNGFTFLAFLVPVSAGLRLARFNLDARERTYFYGLPTPAGALFAFGLLWILILPTTALSRFFLNPVFLYGLIFLLVIGYHLSLELPGMKGSRAAKLWLLAIGIFGLTLFFVQREIAVLFMAFSYLLTGVIHRLIKIY